MSSSEKWLPYDEARSFVRALSLRTQNDYAQWIKSENRHPSIPANPHVVYEGQWDGWADFLGNGGLRPRRTKRPGRLRPYSEARAFVRTLKLNTQKQWYEWTKSPSRPVDIPSNPRDSYGDEWTGWADWLGTGPPGGRPRSRRGVFLPFEEARAFAHTLSFTTQGDWFRWAKSDERPSNIPADPSRAYREKGWIGWPDWLGRAPSRATGKEFVRPFVEAREFARSLGLSGIDEWTAFARSSDRPSDIPRSPDARYRDDGWIGWADWLGTYSRWTHRSIVSFLTSLKPIVHDLSEVELFLILSKNRMLHRDRRSRNPLLARRLVKLRRSEDIDSALKDVARSLEDESEEPDKPSEETEDHGEDLEGQARAEDLSEPDALGEIKSLESLKSLDQVVKSFITEDPEILDFMVRNRVALLWQQVIDGHPGFTIEGIRAFDGGDQSTRVKDLFLEEYRGAKELTVPPGIRFENKGGLFEPNLMQRLTAYRLLQEKRVGNWSGVGAGKTHAALLSAAVLGARLTVVCVANSTLLAWKNRIEQTIPGAEVIVKKGALQSSASRPTFLILNYESFQQHWSAEFVKDLTTRNKIDFIIIDEVQFAKQRYANRPSRRRTVVEDLVCEATARNPELRVLGMSATPVINNLMEATKLLQLVTGKDFSHVRTGSSVPNAVGVHLQLRRYGIRYRPQYDLSLEVQTPILDGIDLLSSLCGVPAREVLRMEHAVLGAKLKNLADYVRPKTIVYTHYVRGIVERLTESVSQLGFRVGHYTGASKAGLGDFLKGKVDVLIGSSPVGTGIDGLQYVCNRLIFISLPWSNAEYEQIIGRLHRQGSAFKKIEVIIPQVVLSDKKAGLWSWDSQRLQCIHYKRTLADAALDGTIPLGSLPSKEELQRRSLVALHDWISRVGRGVPPQESEPPVSS